MAKRLTPAEREAKMLREEAGRIERATIRRLEKRAALTPSCAECGGQEAQLVGGDAVYGHRPDLSDKLYWRCPCGAYCGTHKGTERPLGRPAAGPTLAARRAAHAALDPLWQGKMRRDGVDQKEARGAAYRWMAEQLGIPQTEMHIGLMDRATAERVVTICTALRRPR